MKVRALEMGFFNGRRIRAGHEFEVPDGTKAKWFVPADGAAEDKPAKPKREARALSEMGNEKAQSFTEVVSKA